MSAGHGTGRVSPADSLAYEGAASAGAGVAGVSADMCRVMFYLLWIALLSSGQHSLGVPVSARPCAG